MSSKPSNPAMVASPLEKLISSAKRNDESAWRQLIALYADQMRQWCIAGQAQRNELAALFTEVWSAAYRCISGFQPSEKLTFHGWLLMLTINHLRHRYRSGNRDPASYETALEQLRVKSQIPTASLSQKQSHDPELDHLKQIAFAAVRNALPMPSVTMPTVSAETEANRKPAPEQNKLRDLQLGPVLGQGGMGVVYHATHVRLKRDVAVKMLTVDADRFPNGVARFEREMEAVGQLDHPNIVRALDAGEENGKLFLVLEYLDGSSLKEVVQQRGPLSIAEACDAIRQTALGLHYAHQRGITHRDIKPSNLLQSADGQVKILDFGLARWQDSIEGDFTQQGYILGTPDYMAPEQADDSRKVGPVSDLFSLGATFYYLLAAERPFPGDTFAQKVHALHAMSPKPIAQFRSDCPPEIVQIIDQLMAKDPAQRIASAEEVAKRLERFCSDKTAVAPAPAGTVDYGKPVATSRRRWPMLIGAAVGTVAVVVLLMVAFGVFDGGKTGSPSGVHGDDPGLPQEPKAIASLSGSKGRILNLAFHPNGKSAYSIADAQPYVISEWDLGKHTHLDKITANWFKYPLVCSPDGKTIATSSGYGAPALLIVELSSKTILYKLQSSNRQQITSCCFSPNGKYIATADVRGEIIVFEIAKQSEYCKFSHGSRGYQVAFSSDNRLLASAGNDGYLRVWDVQAGNLVSQLKAHKGYVCNLLFTKDGKKLISSGFELQYFSYAAGSIQVWDLNKKQRLQTLLLGDDVTSGAVIAPNGKYAVSGNRDGTVAMWSLTKMERVFARPIHTASITCIAVSSNSREAITGASDNLIWHFQLPSP